MRTAEFIRVLPKAELHLHLEGAVPWAMVRAHSAQTLPERPPWYAEGFRFDDFLEFRGAIRDCMSCLVDAPAYGAAAGAIFRGLRAQNVRYAEISFDVVRALDLRLEIAEVVAAVKAAEPPGLITRVFAALSQHKHERTPPAVVETVLSAPGLDGLSVRGFDRRAIHRRWRRGSYRGADSRCGSPEQLQRRCWCRREWSRAQGQQRGGDDR